MTDEPYPESAFSRMRRTWYVWEMNKSKKRIKPETKLRMKEEFEDAVLDYAGDIIQGRLNQENMEEYRRITV